MIIILIDCSSSYVTGFPKKVDLSNRTTVGLLAFALLAVSSADNRFSFANHDHTGSMTDDGGVLPYMYMGMIGYYLPPSWVSKFGTSPLDSYHLTLPHSPNCHVTPSPI